MSPSPYPGELWHTAHGRNVEILARDIVYNAFTEEVDTVAYKFLGGSMIHLRSVNSIESWKRVNFE